mmetsp:Transcript_15097/g.21116  ORF Transcript_15097/g.21116 Transcript_15097/m.21116 type:complete len:330 (-) Transcript_15097:184-1173(-)
MGLNGRITPKRQATRRALKDREPKAVENVKKSMFIRGPKTSQVVVNALKDLYVMKKPHGKMLNKKNKFRPFEDHSSLEFLSNQMDSSLFAFGTLTKKKGHCLTLGRMFNYQLLDMIELSINVDMEFKPISAFSGERKKSVFFGSKPMFVFQGEQFEVSDNHKELKSLILDFFRGEVVEKINLAGLDRVIVCTATQERIFFRHYAVALRRSGKKIPNVVLDEIGPRMNWQLRRIKSADAEVKKLSMRQPKIRKSQAKMKNIERGTLGAKMGRIHMERQDTESMALRKFKALKNKKRKPRDDDDDDDDGSRENNRRSGKDATVKRVKTATA